MNTPIKTPYSEETPQNCCTDDRKLAKGQSHKRVINYTLTTLISDFRVQ